MLFLSECSLISNIARVNNYWTERNKQQNLLIKVEVINAAYLTQIKPIHSYSQVYIGDCHSETKSKKIAKKTK